MTHTACAELRFKQLWPFYLAQSDSIYSSLISRVVAIKSPFTLGKGSVLFWKLTNWFKVLVELPSWAMTKWLADEDRKDNISSLFWLANLLFFDCLVCSPSLLGVTFFLSYLFFTSNYNIQSVKETFFSFSFPCRGLFLKYTHGLPVNSKLTLPWENINAHSAIFDCYIWRNNLACLTHLWWFF